MDRNQIDYIKSNTDLVQLISTSTQLKKSGLQRWVGLCPFHAERTPSFSVNPSLGFWYCFGCHEHGDAIRFLQLTQGVTFVEAVNQLASRLGIEITEDDPTTAQHYGEIRRAQALLKNLVNQGSKHLLESPDTIEIRRWLKQRGCPKQQAIDWSLGVFPRGALESVRRQEPALAHTLGLTAPHWVGRVIFPIHDQSGQVIAISGRKIDDNAPGGKYVNSPANLLYDKSRALYGMYQAAQQARRFGYIVIVEGQMDCLVMHAAGYTNTVAACGTAISLYHLRWIARLVPRLVLCLDGDHAGRSGVDKVVAASRGIPLEIQWAVLPMGKDPSDLVQAGQGEVIKAAIEGAETPIRVQLTRLASKIDAESDIEARSRLIGEGMRYIYALHDPIQRHSYLDMWSDQYQVPIPVDPALAQRAADLAPPTADMNALYLLITNPGSINLRPWMVHKSLRDIVRLCNTGVPVGEMMDPENNLLDAGSKTALAEIMQLDQVEDSVDDLLRILVLRTAQRILAETSDLLNISSLAKAVALAKTGDAAAIERLAVVIENSQREYLDSEATAHA